MLFDLSEAVRDPGISLLSEPGPALTPDLLVSHKAHGKFLPTVAACGEPATNPLR